MLCAIRGNAACLQFELTTRALLLAVCQRPVTSAAVTFSGRCKGSTSQEQLQPLVHVLASVLAVVRLTAQAATGNVKPARRRHLVGDHAQQKRGQHGQLEPKTARFGF